MNEFEMELKEVLRAENKFDPGKGEDQRKEIVQMYESWSRTALIIAWLGIGIGIVLEIVGICGLVLSLLGFFDIKLMILFAVVALSGGQWHLLAKLWYWVFNTKLSLRKDLKELQLQVTELSAKVSPDEQ